MRVLSERARLGWTDAASDTNGGLMAEPPSAAVARDRAKVAEHRSPRVPLVRAARDNELPSSHRPCSAAETLGGT